MPGVAGVGLEVEGNTLPCISCYSVPTGAIVLPPSYYVIAPSQQKTAIFFSSVETGNLSGPATFSLQITEAGSRTVVLSSTQSATLPANSTNFISWSTPLPDDNGYSGPEGVVFTISVGGVTVQNTAQIWAIDNAQGDFGQAEPNSYVQPMLMPGVAGVGLAGGYPLCVSCYGVPTGAFVVSAPYYIIAPYEAVGLMFYASVQVGDLTGTATTGFQVTEAATGKVVMDFTATQEVQANATNLLGWDTDLLDGDGYKGLEKVVYTTTIGNITTQSTTHIWVIRHIPGT